MKVEIWSDVVCPFCYVGKRKFEKALGEFAHRDDVQVEWKSYQLSADFVPVPGESIHASLAKKKGVPEAEGRRMNDYMTQVAQEVGLPYDFDRVIPANTFLAHQLIHFGAHHGQQDATKERLMAAYYLEGQDLNSLDTLVALAAEVGLDADAARQALLAGTYANEVRRDEYEAQQIGVRGVPFFVFDDKYAVSGAQPSEVFAEVLGKVWAEGHTLPSTSANTSLGCAPDTARYLPRCWARYGLRANPRPSLRCWPMALPATSKAVLAKEDLPLRYAPPGGRFIALPPGGAYAYRS